MNTSKKHKLNPSLDKYEQDIEDNLSINKALPTKEKAREISKLKMAAKEHLKKGTKKNVSVLGYLQKI